MNFFVIFQVLSQVVGLVAARELAQKLLQIKLHMWLGATNYVFFKMSPHVASFTEEFAAVLEGAVELFPVAAL